MVIIGLIYLFSSIHFSADGAYVRTILRVTSMMITNTEMTNWIIEKFSGSGGIRTHDLRVTSPLLYQLRYRALGAVREWIPIYMVLI